MDEDSKTARGYIGILETSNPSIHDFRLFSNKLRGKIRGTSTPSGHRRARGLLIEAIVRSSAGQNVSELIARLGAPT